MNRIVLRILLFLLCSLAGFAQTTRPKAETVPSGFAGVNARGLATTTGGAGGKIYTIKNADTLYALLRSLRGDRTPGYPPTIIYIDGTVPYAGDKMVYFKDNANISIIGKGNNAKFVGFGLEVQNSRNIVIRNIEFNNCPVDGINIADPTTHHIWVDHCTFTDGEVPDTSGSNHDGALDIKMQASYITVSWCRFYNHSKLCLMGHDDGETADTVMTVSYHHNWFEKTRQRHPRVRFGKAHVYNNFYDANDIYGIVSACEADVLVEGCYFENVPHPSYVGYMTSGPGDLVQRGNVFLNCLNPIQTRGSAFEAAQYYNYTLDDVNAIPSMLRAFSGSGKIEIPAGVIDEKGMPEKFTSILESYPNPFNPSTVLSFRIGRSSAVRLAVYNQLGEEVASVFEGRAEKNIEYRYPFRPGFAASGIYVAVLTAGEIRLVRKIIYSK